MDGPACPGCRALRVEVAELRAQVAELKRRLDEALRAGKRQAAPFRKGPPKPDPKPPGRKAGDAHGPHGHRPLPPPEQLTECHEAALPEECPHCHGPIAEIEVARQYQIEIPRRPIVRQFNVHVGRCERCGRRVQGRHPLQTSDALGAAASQVGPDAQAAAVLLNKQAGLSHGKVSAVFESLFGIDLTRGASAQINLRAAERLEPDYRLILEDIRAAEQITPDETGWREGGHPAWLHVWVGDRGTAYAIDSQRSAAVLGELDRRLADAAAIAAAEPGYGQPQLDGLATDRYGADGAFFGPVTDDVGGLAVGTAVVLGVLDEVEREDAMVGGRSLALVLTKAERAIE